MLDAFEFHPSRDYGTHRTAARRKSDENVPADKAAELRQLGRRLAEPSLIARYMALNPTAQDAFQERAAILEFEDGLPRAQAELQAFRMVMHLIAEGL